MKSLPAKRALPFHAFNGFVPFYLAELSKGYATTRALKPSESPTLAEPLFN